MELHINTLGRYPTDDVVAVAGMDAIGVLRPGRARHAALGCGRNVSAESAQSHRPEGGIVSDQSGRAETAKRTRLAEGQ